MELSSTNNLNSNNDNTVLISVADRLNLQRKKLCTPKRIIMVMSCIAIIVCLGLAISLCVVVGKFNKICTTATCIHIASDLMNYMDQTTNPCDDFYQFVCGKFLNTTIIPPDGITVNAFEELQTKISLQLYALMNESVKPTDSNFVKNTKIFYQSCVNVRSLNNKDGYKPVLSITETLGGWPVLLDKWNKTQFDWKSSVYQFNNIGLSPDYFITCKTVRRNNTDILTLSGPSLNFPPTRLLAKQGNETTARYYIKMVNIAVALGATKKRAEQELLDSFKFEIQLANISMLNSEERNDSMNNPITMTIGNLTQLYPSVPWNYYINQLQLNNKIYRMNDTIELRLSFIAKFVKLMIVTPKRIQANYIMWRAVFFSVNKLNFTSSFLPKSLVNRIPRWKLCRYEIRRNFGRSLANMYLKKYFDKNTKLEVRTMSRNIKNEFEKTLRTTKWLDDETQKNALEKLKNLTFKIAYPDVGLDDESIEKLHTNITMTDCYLRNILNLTKAIKMIKREETDEIIKWMFYGVHIVNAFYTEDNTIVLPAGILQGAFFNINAPKYMNYGAIGFDIGHEIIHGYDATFGNDTRYPKSLSEWCAAESKKIFLEKAQCFVDQYNSYAINGKKIDGTRTLHENIADNGGIKLAYRAYNNWLKSHNQRELQIPGLPSYTNQQMFWISATREYCTAETWRAMTFRLNEDSHTLVKFRIFGTLSNTPEFSKDFNCPIGSRMNPKDKCTIW